MDMSVDQTFETFPSVDSLNVAYDLGEKDKLTIVLLHGIATTSATWKYIVNYLDKSKFRIIALDILGFGASPKPLACTYSVEEHVSYIHETLNNLHITKPYILVGHSMGSLISARYAKEYPVDIDRMYLLSPPIYHWSNGSKKTLKSLQTYFYFKHYEFLAKNKTAAKYQTRLIRDLMRIDMEVNDDNWESFRHSIKNIIINQTANSDICSVKCPIHIMFGNLDQFLIRRNILEHAKTSNVKITRLNLVDHVVTERYSRVAAAIINDQN